MTESAVEEFALEALRVGSAAISRAPRELQAAVQSRYDQLLDNQRRIENGNARANPLHVDPTAGLH